MKLAHFVITRFCLSGGVRLFRACDGPPLDFWSSDPLEPWLVNHRLKLLEAICLPGLRSQTNQDFTWVLLVDADLREDFKARLRNLARARDRVVLHEHRSDAPDRLETLGWLDCLPASRPDYVLTTLNDDDDLLPRRFVEVVQSHAVEPNAQGRLPPFKIMGATRIVQWDMLFTRDAPLGWAAPWRGSASVACPGFSLLCRYPAFDFSVLGLRHSFATVYFDFHAPPPIENVRFYRQAFLEAARDARVGMIPTGDDAFFDASRQAGAVLMSNHGANMTSAQPWRLSFPAHTVPREPPVTRRKVLGAETFPDASLDWDAVRRYSNAFRSWRVGLRLLKRRLSGRKGRNVGAVRSLRDRLCGLRP